MTSRGRASQVGVSLDWVGMTGSLPRGAPHAPNATFVLAIVAMCTNRLGQGIALLVSSVGSGIVCIFIGLVLLSNAFTAALKKERAMRTGQRATPVAMAHATTTHTPLQSLLGPGKAFPDCES
jgi:xanthine/uracil permease